MNGDKYTALWISHTSIGDFLACQRTYYLKHVYKDPATGHKIKIISPPLALGQAVHEVIEEISTLSKDERFILPLIQRFDQAWTKVAGKKGGFTNIESETNYKKRGQEMVGKLIKNPGPLKNLAVKINQNLPHYWFSKKDNIILCGKIDWLEYLPNTDSVHIIDFKTSKNDESPESLQLSIYHLLARNCQRHPVAKASYWYLERSDKPSERKLPDPKKSEEKILEIAKKIKLARQLERFKCPHNGCHACRPYEKILQGSGELVGVDSFRTDVYIVDKNNEETKKESVIL